MPIRGGFPTKQVRATGSISQGKTGWNQLQKRQDAINEMNQLAEETIVDRATGGKGGGGATLTRYGERALTCFL